MRCISLNEWQFTIGVADIGIGVLPTEELLHPVLLPVEGCDQEGCAGGLGLCLGEQGVAHEAGAPGLEHQAAEAEPDPRPLWPLTTRGHTRGHHQGPRALGPGQAGEQGGGGAGVSLGVCGEQTWPGAREGHRGQGATWGEELGYLGHIKGIFSFTNPYYHWRHFTARPPSRYLFRILMLSWCLGSRSEFSLYSSHRPPPQPRNI